MQIKFLGTGSAFDYQKGNSAAIVENNGVKVLIDCGPTIFGRLCETGEIDKIDYVIITHLHGDHVGSLFPLIMYRFVRLDLKTIFLCPNAEFSSELKQLLDLQWTPPERYEIRNLSELDWVQVIDTHGQHVPDMNNFACYFTAPDHLIYYSGDLGQVQTTVDFLATRTETNIQVFQDIAAIEKPSHVYYQTAMRELSDYSIYGYHCARENMPDDNTIPLVEDQPELLY